MLVSLPFLLQASLFPLQLSQQLNVLFLLPLSSLLLAVLLIFLPQRLFAQHLLAQCVFYELQLVPLLLYRQLLYCLRLFLFCVEYLVFSVHSHPHFLHLQSLLNSLLFAKPANITRSHNKVSGLLCG